MSVILLSLRLEGQESKVSPPEWGGFRRVGAETKVPAIDSRMAETGSQGHVIGQRGGRNGPSLRLALPKSREKAAFYSFLFDSGDQETEAIGHLHSSATQPAVSSRS